MINVLGNVAIAVSGTTRLAPVVPGRRLAALVTFTGVILVVIYTLIALSTIVSRVMRQPAVEEVPG